MISPLHFNTGSAVHRMDPRVKLVYFVLAITCLLMFDHPLVMAAFMLILFGLAATYIDLRHLRPFIKFLLPLFALFTFIQGFIRPEGAVLWHLPDWLPLGAGAAIHLGGIVYGVGMAFRLFGLLLTAALVSMTTKAADLVLAMRSFGLPFTYAFTLTSTTRLVPTVARDAACVGDAQRARGVSLDGGLLKRIRAYRKILTPLLNCSFDRAHNMAVAMESRAFGPSCQTTYKKLRMKRGDWMLLVVAVLVMALAAFTRLKGYGVA